MKLFHRNSVVLNTVLATRTVANWVHNSRSKQAAIFAKLPVLCAVSPSSLNIVLIMVIAVVAWWYGDVMLGWVDRLVSARHGTGENNPLIKKSRQPWYGPTRMCPHLAAITAPTGTLEKKKEQKLITESSPLWCQNFPVYFSPFLLLCCGGALLVAVISIFYRVCGIGPYCNFNFIQIFIEDTFKKFDARPNLGTNVGRTEITLLDRQIYGIASKLLLWIDKGSAHPTGIEIWTYSQFLTVKSVCPTLGAIFWPCA